MKSGKPVGVWEYYDGKELALKFDYDSSRIRYVKTDTAQYWVRVDTTWQVHHPDRAPRLLGSKDELLGKLARRMRYPVGDLQGQKSGTVILTYVIDEQGKRTTPVATTTPSVSMAKEVYRVLESVPVAYLPAIYQGKPVPAKIAFVVRFALCSAPTDCQTSLTAQARAVPKPVGSQGEVVVSAGVQQKVIMR